MKRPRRCYQHHPRADPLTCFTKEGLAVNATRKCLNHPDRTAQARSLCGTCYGRAYRAGKLQPELPIDIHSLSEIDPIEGTGVCAICGPVRVRIRGKGKGAECSTVRRRHRARARKPTSEQRLRWAYGLTPSELEDLLAKAGGRCAICEREAPLVVDHCHETGRVRGMLCQRCNVALGWMEDDISRLKAAADYLQG